MAAIGRYTLSRRRDRIIGKVTGDQLHSESVNTTRAAVTTIREHDPSVLVLCDNTQDFVCGYQ